MKPATVARVAFAILAVLLVVAIFYIGVLRKAARAAEQKAEAAQLEAKGLLVAAGEKQSQLKGDIGDLQKQFAGLKEALAAAQAKTPATRIVEVAKFTTLPAIVTVAPVESTDGGCVLAPGDDAQVRIAEIRLQTKLGNVLAVGVAEAWRLKPLPEVKLFASSFETDASAMHADVAALDNSLPGWGAGPYFGGGVGGWVVGATVVSPVVPIFWGLKMEAIGDVGLGPTGNVQGGLGVVLRK